MTDFIKKIKIFQILPCIPDPNKIRFIAYFEEDTSEILPYLNAIVKRGIYNPNGPTLTIKKKDTSLLFILIRLLLER